MPRGRPSINKRNREQARRETRENKAVRQAERNAEKAARPVEEHGVDPDIAHIKHGPQPKPDD